MLQPPAPAPALISPTNEWSLAISYRDLFTAPPIWNLSYDHMNNKFILYILNGKKFMHGSSRKSDLQFDLIVSMKLGLNWQELFGGCMYILKRFQVINCVSPAAPQAECWPSVLSIRAPHECPLVHHYSGNVYKQTEAAG